MTMGDSNLDVEVTYLSAGANRQTGVADWNQDGTLAFGADSNICLWRPMDSEDRGVTALLSGHQDTVKAVKFLSYDPVSSISYLVSGSDDKSLKLWALNLKKGTFSCVQTVQEHTAAVNCIANLPASQDSSSSRCLFASGAADATIKIWELSSSTITLVQTIKTAPKFFPLAVALHPLGSNQDSYVLAVAGTRDIIQIFATDSSSTETEFTLKATLTGHEGWIRSLDFAHETDSPTSDVLLASASQDKYIRLWRLHQGSSLPAAPAAGSDPSLGAYLPGKSPSNKAHRFRSGAEDYSVTFEALLLGHDDWIYTAKWHHSSDKLELLSASADNSISVWEAEPSSGIWITSARLGEISREKGATTATGSIGGFWTGLWAPDGKSVVTLGRTGSWRRWDRQEENDYWVPGLAVSGHTRAVTGLAWARDGGYLLSTSSDQTTRQHAEWIVGEDGKRQRTTWHEMSRPQIHGYDLNCIDSLPNNSFVSGADEKLMRVFSAPKAVVRLVSRLTGRDTSEAALEALPAEAADIPVLGLSNKAVVDGGGDDFNPNPADQETDPETAPPPPPKATSHLDSHPSRPPLEDLLSRATLWPETEKLYGHGYELSCLAASHSGKLIASACRASSVNHAVVRLFETERWTEVRPPLAAHTLTATRVRFSEDDGLILSVGRDRQWVVWERRKKQDGGEGYELLQNDAKGHSRMILDAAWAPDLERGGRVFATAGRDKQVKIWVRRGEEGKFVLGKAVAFEGPVTAVDFLGRRGGDGELVLAVGTEGGKIAVVRVLLGEEGVEVRSLETVGDQLCLPRAVLQLAWRPVEPEVEMGGAYDLAVAGEDSSLRIYKVKGL